MSPLTIFLARLFGAYSLVAAAWLLARKETVLALVDRIFGDPVFESLIGLLRLIVGLAIVIGHDRWGNWVEILVSLIGWIALFSGMSALFLPSGTLRRAIVLMRFRENLPLYALLYATLGAALLLGGFIG